VFRIQTPDGRTEVLDLRDSSQARAFLRGELSALTIANPGVRCRECGRRAPGFAVTLAAPAGFNAATLEAEHVPSDGSVRGGERMVAFCDDARLIVMSHADTPAVRLVLNKPGRRRFAPPSR